MAATREQLGTLFSRVQSLEEQKSDLSGQIKDAFSTFASQYGEGREKSFTKAIKKTYKNYKELQKDRAEFVLVEADADSMTEALLTTGGE